MTKEKIAESSIKFNGTKLELTGEVLNVMNIFKIEGYAERVSKAKEKTKELKLKIAEFKSQLNAGSLTPDSISKYGDLKQALYILKDNKNCSSYYDIAIIPQSIRGDLRHGKYNNRN